MREEDENGLRMVRVGNIINSDDDQTRFLSRENTNSNKTVDTRDRAESRGVYQFHSNC